MNLVHFSHHCLRPAFLFLGTTAFWAGWSFAVEGRVVRRRVSVASWPLFARWQQRTQTHTPTKLWQPKTPPDITKYVWRVGGEGTPLPLLRTTGLEEGGLLLLFTKPSNYSGRWSLSYNFSTSSDQESYQWINKLVFSFPFLIPENSIFIILWNCNTPLIFLLRPPVFWDPVSHPQNLWLTIN